ncbi:MAG: AAA family ATPase [Lachnospiraceae bacterium]|nr:AAA family ATPase [Lachnospiraceae bacterium]
MSLTRSQYQQMMQEYDQLQFKSRHELNNRKAEIAQRIPRILEISDEITSLGIQATKAKLARRNEEHKACLDKISSLSREKADLLAAHGYAEDYLMPRFACRDCSDTGYVDGRPCHCLTQRTINLLYQQSNLGDILQRENFSQFSFSYYSSEEGARDSLTGETPAETIRRVFDYCQKFAATFKKTGENLLLYGPVGVGKTFLTHCIAKEALENSKSVIYLSSGQLFEILSDKAFAGGRKDDEQMAACESIFACDLLIIDDLGAEFSNTFTLSSLFHCLNERMLAKKSTIISTNLSLADLRNVYSERISSRITGNYTLLKINGNDIRRQRRMQPRNENV